MKVDAILLFLCLGASLSAAFDASPNGTNRLALLGINSLSFASSPQALSSSSSSVPLSIDTIKTEIKGQVKDWLLPDIQTQASQTLSLAKVSATDEIRKMEERVKAEIARDVHDRVSRSIESVVKSELEKKSGGDDWDQRREREREIALRFSTLNSSFEQRLVDISKTLTQSVDATIFEIQDTTDSKLALYNQTLETLVSQSLENSRQFITSLIDDRVGEVIDSQLSLSSSVKNLTEFVVSVNASVEGELHLRNSSFTRIEERFENVDIVISAVNESFSQKISSAESDLLTLTNNLGKDLASLDSSIAELVSNTSNAIAKSNSILAKVIKEINVTLADLQST